MKLMVVEILILGSVLYYLWTREPVRRWRETLNPGDLNLLVLLTLLFVGGHFINAGGNLFPLIRWGMYGKVYEPEKIEWAELHITFSDNTKQIINPALEFPSIARNFSERLNAFVIASDRQQLDSKNQATYRNLLNSYAAKLNRNNKTKQVTHIEAVLCSVAPLDRDSLIKKTVDCQNFPNGRSSVSSLSESNKKLMVAEGNADRE